MPSLRFSCNARMGAFNSSRRAVSSLARSENPAASSSFTRESVCSRRRRTSVLSVLLECSSRQKSPMPMASSLFLTTSSAAFFSATNSTRLPSARALAMMLVMVWLLPVPGGPCSTKLAPAPESATAEKFAAWREHGADRISMGIQTLSDGCLKAIGRLHTAAEGLEKLALAGKFFPRVSCDIIVGLPTDSYSPFPRAPWRGSRQFSRRPRRRRAP